MAPEKKQQLVLSFQNGHLDVLVLGIKSGGVGFNLTRAREVLLVEMPWSPLMALQCEARAVRIGLVQGLLARYLVAAGTIDEILWKNVENKAKDIGEVIDGDEKSLDFTATSWSEESSYWAVCQAVVEDVKRKTSLPGLAA